jgi:acyl phosphate:glycerol-3-phosphate acyltransferase
MHMDAFFYAVSGYLIGSIPFAVVVSRVMGLEDPRSYGSGNPGATNVLRSGNKLAALLTLVGDAAKGFFAVWLALRLEASPELVAITALTVFLGHVFSFWLRFQGGKGVATAAGVLVALDWRIGLAVLGAWLAVVITTRYSSLGAVVGAFFAPAATYYVLGAGPVFLATLAMGAILLWRHEANIRKLLNGEESRIGEGKKDDASAGQPG